MSILKNIKDPITDIIGLVIMIVTIIEKYNGHIDWIWEGVAGITIGCALFVMPDEWLNGTIKKVGDKFTK
jgi:hypothetical protein